MDEPLKEFLVKYVIIWLWTLSFKWSR